MARSAVMALIHWLTVCIAFVVHDHRCRTSSCVSQVRHLAGRIGAGSPSHGEASRAPSRIETSCVRSRCISHAVAGRSLCKFTAEWKEFRAGRGCLHYLPETIVTNALKMLSLMNVQYIPPECPPIPTALPTASCSSFVWVPRGH
jgi:hypothetical protein